MLVKWFPVLYVRIASWFLLSFWTLADTLSLLQTDFLNCSDYEGSTPDFPHSALSARSFSSPCHPSVPLLPPTSQFLPRKRLLEMSPPQGTFPDPIPDRISTVSLLWDQWHHFVAQCPSSLLPSCNERSGDIPFSYPVPSTLEAINKYWLIID